MKATVIIEYDENLKGDSAISVLSKTEPSQFQLSEIMLLGILQMAQVYVMRED